VFYHIPKSAGSSLDIILADLAKKSLRWKFTEWYSYYGRSKGADILPSLKWNHSRIHVGHVTPKFIDVTHTERCKLISLLREPVDRAISAFYYHGHYTKEWDACLFSTNSSSCQYHWQYNNDMVRILAGQSSTWDTNDATKYAETPVNRTSLVAAQQFLLNLDLVCFQNQLETCVKHLKNLLGINASSTTATTIFRANVNRKRPFTDDITHQKVVAMNSLDAELYEWALTQNFTAYCGHTEPTS
jgi:Sulfotransferase family